MLVAGQEAIFKKLDLHGGQLTDIQVKSVERTAKVDSVAEKLDANAAAHTKALGEVEERRKKDSARITAIEEKIEEREGLFQTARKVGAWVITGIGLTVIASVLMVLAWIIRKTTGIDISPWTHVAGGH